VLGVVLTTAIVSGPTGPLVAGWLGVRTDIPQDVDAGGVPLRTARARLASQLSRFGVDRNQAETAMLLTGKTPIFRATTVCYP